jgi:hypothetical protein
MIESLSVSISRSIPDQDREELINILGGSFDIIGEEGHQLSPDWITVIAFAKDVGSVAGTATAIITLAEKISAWRKKMQSSKHNSNVQLEGDGREVLDLAQADDDEIEAWFQGGR